MKLTTFLRVVAAGAALLACNAFAQSEGAIKQNIEAATQGKVRVESVKPTPVKGIYQVVSDGEIFYTDATGRYGFVGGALVDMQSQKDLTEPEHVKLTAVDWNKLPLQYAVMEVHGTGARKIALFEDPNCPVCKVFTKFVSQLDNVTIYRFMFPVISPESQSTARVAWCAADRGKAWELAMAGNRITGDESCDITGLGNILKFGEQVKIDATPTVFLGNGKRLVGATPPEIFVAELDASIKK